MVFRECFVYILNSRSMIHGHTGARSMASFVVVGGFSPQKLLCKFVDTL